MNKNNVHLFVVISVLFFLLPACSKQEENKSASGSTPESPATSITKADPAGSTITESTDTSANLGDTAAVPDSNSSANQTETDSVSEVPVKSTEQTPGADQATQVTASGKTDDHEEQLALARKSGCLACHSVEKKIVGPAWRDVSRRYKGDANAKSRLIAKVSKGGSGNWKEVVGTAAMPPYSPRVSNENIEKLVGFVLSLEK